MAQPDPKLLERFVEDEPASQAMTFERFVELSSDRFLGGFSEEDLLEKDIVRNNDGRFLIRLDAMIYIALNAGCKPEECVYAPDLWKESLAYGQALLDEWEKPICECGQELEVVYQDLGDPENGPKLEADVICRKCDKR